MATFTGPSFAVADAADGIVAVYVTGRDRENRSRIGVATLRLSDATVVAVGDEPVFDIGVRGAFDENGVSYPWIVASSERRLMYYVGWMPTVLTPFQNHLGLAIQEHDQPWRRFSRAPILERTDEEFLSIGSAAVLREPVRWRMYYTCFRAWAESECQPKHVYVIKYAESTDGLHWNRENKTCIDIEGEGEYSIGRPSVLFDNGLYHMWYSYRGRAYRIGYAWSEDGVGWTRRDDLAGIDVSNEGWDSESVCYSHVFRFDDELYMLYCGNHYGRDGLGLARWEPSPKDADVRA